MKGRPSRSALECETQLKCKSSNESKISFTAYKSNSALNKIETVGIKDIIVCSLVTKAWERCYNGIKGAVLLLLIQFSLHFSYKGLRNIEKRLKD